MGSSFRKRTAQAGVVLYIIANLGGPFLMLFAVVVLLIAAILPRNPEDSWGSMWPLVGYDNAIDAIYTRGQWLTRFQELDELEAERRLTDGIASTFGAE